MQLENKVVLITGASSGIGKKLADLLADENCKLALLARRENLLLNQVKKLRSLGKEAIAVPCDVSDKNDVKKAFEKSLAHFGKIDIAILNAGTSSRTTVENFSSSEAKKIFNVNVLGMIYCVEEILPHFMSKNSGMIIGVSSLAEGRGFPKSGFYCSSKAAVSILLESLRVELKKYNIKVLTVKPGFVKTEMTAKNEFKMPFLMEVEKACEIIINGIKKEKRIIQFPLPTTIGAKILKILPNSLFELIAKRT